MEEKALAVRTVGIDAPLRWLRKGWEDLRYDPLSSLGFGVVFAIGGGLIVLTTLRAPHLMAVAFSGFFSACTALGRGTLRVESVAGHGRAASLFRRAGVGQSEKSESGPSGAGVALGDVGLGAFHRDVFCGFRFTGNRVADHRGVDRFGRGVAARRRVVRDRRVGCCGDIYRDRGFRSAAFGSRRRSFYCGRDQCPSGAHEPLADGGLGGLDRRLDIAGVRAGALWFGGNPAASWSRHLARLSRVGG